MDKTRDITAKTPSGQDRAASKPDNGGDAWAVSVSASLIERAFQLANDVQANTILIYVDALPEDDLALPDNAQQRIYFVTKQPPSDDDDFRQAHDVIRVPDVTLTRMGQVKIALLLAMARGMLSHGDIVVAISGLPTNGMLDTAVVMQVGQEFETFLMPGNGSESDMFPNILPEVLETIIDIAAELGSQGREGRPVGALFVIGDSDRVLSLSRQLILNPFQGYPPARRNMLDPQLKETIKELATIDGAFVIRGDGVIESAGTYLKTASQEEFKLPPGLGARHHAAAAITSVSSAVAITVSQSTGTVSIFRNGRMITELEKPRSGVLGRQL